RRCRRSTSSSSNAPSRPGSRASRGPAPSAATRPSCARWPTSPRARRGGGAGSRGGRLVRVAIVGGGISGLTAAHLLGARGHDVVLADAGERPGGVIRSERRAGFLCETGPQAVIDGPEETRGLIASLDLGARMLHARESARRRFVYVDGAL